MRVITAPFGALSAMLVAIPLASAACESGGVASKPNPAPVQPAAAPPPAVPAPGATAPAARGTQFGAAFEPGPTVPLASLLANPAAYSDQNVITEGHVQRACSNKGCWMEIGEGDAACRVTFKDYGFFVPTDSAGARARIQGRLATQRVEPGRVAHLEGEGARFKNKQSDGSATEVQLIATAVELTR